MPRPYRNSFEPRVNVDMRALNERLRSCYGLPDSECSEIKEILALAEQDIADYDAEMHRMRLRREGLKQYAKKLSTLLSPVRRLPNELLIKVFEGCCEENDLTLDRPGNALTISAVCARWHDLSITHPALWSNLILYLDDEDAYGWENVECRKRSEDRLASTVELYLKRSKNHTLILDIEPISRGDGSEHPALTLLAQQSVRWKSLIYRGYCFSPQWFPCLDSLSLPLLQTAGFLYNDPGSGDCPEIDTPRVNELLFNNEVDSDTVVTFSASWNSLTRLSYDTTAIGSFGMLWEILDLCPKLDCLALQGFNLEDDDVEDDRQSGPPKTLSSLSCLTIANSGFCPDYDTLECVLASLTLPNLIELTLGQLGKSTHKPIITPYAVIQDFFTRSQCSLTSLKMDKISLTDKELVSLLLHHPSLQELSLTDSSTTDSPYHPISGSFIQSLHTWQETHLRRSSEPLVPKLRSLVLRPFNTSEDFDSSSFVETISSRWLPNDASNEFGVVCLRSVELHLPWIVKDSEVYQPLKRFDAAGMRVVVKCQEMEGYLV